MDFALIRVWHVVGYENGDYDRPKIVCGARSGEWFGGGWDDVMRSGVTICRTCDRMTDATQYVSDAYSLLVLG